MNEGTRKIASPTGAALFALAVACFMFWALFLGWVTGGAVIIMAVLLIACAIPQLMASIFDLLKGNALFGNIMCYFASFFMVGTALTLIVEYLCGITGWPIDPTLLGFAWIVLALALWGWTPALLTHSPLGFGILAIAADIALMCVAVSHFGVAVHALHTISGWLLFIVGIIGIYYGWATVLAEHYEREVLPLGKPLIH